MESVRTKDTTRSLGEDQGFEVLHVEDRQYGDGTNEMRTTWRLTPEERHALSCGAFLYVHVLGVNHPPIKLTVGEPQQ